MGNAPGEDADISETPDSKYVVLNFPEDNVCFDFFHMEGKGNYVRMVWSGTNEILWEDKVDHEDCVYISAA